MIQTVDKYVVVLAVSMVQDIDVNELWISIGVRKQLRYLAVDKISKSLGKTSQELCKNSMHSQGVIKRQHLQQKERSPHGKLGNPSTRLRQHSKPSARLQEVVKWMH